MWKYGSRSPHIYNISLLSLSFDNEKRNLLCCSVSGSVLFRIASARRFERSLSTLGSLARVRLSNLARYTRLRTEKFRFGRKTILGSKLERIGNTPVSIYPIHCHRSPRSVYVIMHDGVNPFDRNALSLSDMPRESGIESSDRYLFLSFSRAGHVHTQREDVRE